jgi:hypothetical protein
MPKLTPAEWLLARITNPARAAAIMGDLEELAGTRGRLWFFTAYARTLFSLTWRIVLALAVATVGLQIILNSFHTYTRHMPIAWFTYHSPSLLEHIGPLLFGQMWTMWFVLPFAAVRYGVRDRFVHISFAVAVGTLFTILFIPVASLTCAIATVALVAAAFTSRTWRKPAGVLLGTCVAGVLAFFTLNAVDNAIFRYLPGWGDSHFFRHYGFMLIVRAALLSVAFACARLHGLVLERPPRVRTPA